MDSAPISSLPSPGTRNAEPGTLVVQTAFLGDVVLTLPLIQQLAAQYGPADVLVTPSALPLVAGQAGVRRVLSYDKRGADRGIAGLRRVAGLLRSEGYAHAFLPHRSLRSALLARLAGIPERTGFSGGIAGLLHTRRVARPVERHESQRLLSLTGAALEIPQPWFRISADDRRSVEEWLTAHGVGPEFIVMAPGARWATKRWPGFDKLARRLDSPIVVIGGPEDREVAGRIVGAAPARLYSAAGELSLTQSAALIARATRVISNDSLALHLAVALGRPVVAVVGPTGPAPGFAPPAPLGLVVAHPTLACRPCSPHGHDRCPLGHHRCMVELEAGRVVEVMAEGRGLRAEG